MSRFLDLDLATPGDWLVVPTTQTSYGGAALPTYAVVATGACERFVGRVHPRDGLTDDRPGVQMDARLFASAKAMVRLLERAIAFEAGRFDRDEPVSGTDLVEFFVDWRVDAQRLLDGDPP